MNNFTNLEINKLVVSLQKNKRFEIDSDQLYYLFLEYKPIKKILKNKICKRGFLILIKRFCRMNNYKYEIINKNPVVSKFYFNN
jgi:hypothetical protein